MSKHNDTLTKIKELLGISKEEVVLEQEEVVLADEVKEELEDLHHR